MLVVQQQRTPAPVPRRTAEPRQPSTAETASAWQRPCWGAPETPLSRALARAVAERASAAAEPDGPVLARSLLDDLWKGVSETASDLGERIGEGLSKLKIYADEKEELATYFPYRHPTWSPKPVLTSWLENEGLEKIRNTRGQILSRTKVPTGGDRGATKLLREAIRAWGAETYNLDLLPEGATEGAFDAELKTAVEHFQFFYNLSTDGVVGPRTLAHLDDWVGVHLVSYPNPGGTADRGRSNWDPMRNPIGRIYFETGDDGLGPRERQVIEQIVFEAAAPWRRVEDLEIEVVGYADKRETAEFNEQLSNWRAMAVTEYLKLFVASQDVDATIVKVANGELERPQVGETSAALKPFRRVDIHFPKVDYRPPPKDLAHECTEPTRDWQVQMRNTQSMGEGLTGTVGLVDFRTLNRDSKGQLWKKTYKYAGFGIGVSMPWAGPANISVINEWQTFKTSKALHIWEFGGDAKFEPLGAVAGKGLSHDILRLDGIKQHGAQPVKIVFFGDSTGWGFGVGKDLWGRLTPYSECEQDYDD